MTTPSLAAVEPSLAHAGVVVLAFSGGLDTSFCVPWLRERGYEVHTVFADTGGFDLTVKALGDYDIIAPIREIQREHTEVRAYEQAYLEQRGFAVDARQKSYTINENLLGLTMSGGEIDRWQAPGTGARGWCAERADWPTEPLRVSVRFKHGEAVALDGEVLPGHILLARLNAQFARYGVGRGSYTGDTTIGLKGRILYEAPGLIALLSAHRALEECSGSSWSMKVSSTIR